jgi:DNA modification methylase
VTSEGGIQLPDDYEECAECGYDHSYDPQDAWHRHSVIGTATQAHAADFVKALPQGSVTLFILDPPYYNITADEWDNQWPSVNAYVEWLVDLLMGAVSKLGENGSILLFGGIGKQKEHPFWRVCMRLEEFMTFRNMITWGKRRGYGKSHDYLFCREELAWFSKSSEREKVVFNVPLLSKKRGYAGFNKDYPAKSEYKRVTNVWTDIPELMRPARSCEKPQELYARIVETHSRPGDLVCDFFLGTGHSGCAAIAAGRRFLGCDKDGGAVNMAQKNLDKQRRNNISGDKP